MKNGEQPAFACVDSQHQYLQEGLTKREYFAAMAMQGILAGRKENLKHTNEFFAKVSIDIADALLTELDKTKSE